MLTRDIGVYINVFLYCVTALLFFSVFPAIGDAKNVSHYSDLITNSRPLAQANHTFSFTIKEAIPPGGYIDIDFPSDFELLATSTFDVRNVELYVNTVVRAATTTADTTNDGILITTGTGGSIRYTLNSTTGLHVDDTLLLKVGNHTIGAIQPSTSYSTSTGTTTIPGDIEPIVNSGSPGTYKIPFTVTGGSSGINGEFNIAIIKAIHMDHVDTTETVPPVRFNGAPEGQIGGTTLSVELSVETNEFAICKWSATASTTYAAMSNTFADTGFAQIVHSEIVAVLPDQINTYYIRCIDDEGNFNIDDYIISFIAPKPPVGTPNTVGNVEGDGTGSGNAGAGASNSGGGTAGSAGSGGSSGSQSGSSGGGGGGGGSSGTNTTGTTGGGFESTNGPYRSGNAQVIINGYAFPGSTVYALVDGYVTKNTKVTPNGKYSVTIPSIARGVYTFGVYAVDSNAVKSTTFSTSFTVTGGRTSSLSNINIMPSILVSPDPLTPGDILTIAGFSIPNATVTIENQQDGFNLSKKVFTQTSDGSGAWSITINTDKFSKGTYKVKAKSDALDGSISTDYSEYTFYGVGQEAVGQISADLNTDGKVNLTDFSILLFWWGGDGGNSSPPADINKDGSVSLTDFSIMLFQWTG